MKVLESPPMLLRHPAELKMYIFDATLLPVD
jgi:hypothetical protein